MDFAEIVRRRLDELGLNVNQAELGRGLPQGYIRGVVRDDDKRAVPNIEKAERIARALGLDFYVGPRRNELGFAERDQDFGADQFTRVGSGNLQISFPKFWFAQRDLRTQDLDLSEIAGAWMTPTVPADAMIMFDRSKIDPKPLKGPLHRTRPEMFLCEHAGQKIISRIERPNGTHYMLHFDNLDYPTSYARVAEVMIIGKVVWWGHTERE